MQTICRYYSRFSILHTIVKIYCCKFLLHPSSNRWLNSSKIRYIWNLQWISIQTVFKIVWKNIKLLCKYCEKTIFLFDLTKTFENSTISIKNSGCWNVDINGQFDIRGYNIPSNRQKITDLLTSISKPRMVSLFQNHFKILKIPFKNLNFDVQKMNHFRSVESRSEETMSHMSDRKSPPGPGRGVVHPRELRSRIVCACHAQCTGSCTRRSWPAQRGAEDAARLGAIVFSPLLVAHWRRARSAWKEISRRKEGENWIG